MPYELLSNHRLTPIYDVKFQNTCPSNYYKFNIRLKLDSYYDCTNIKNSELYKDYCQKNIVSNITCCQKSCCSEIDYSENKFQVCSDLDINSNNIINYIRNEDPRSRYCEYFNKYTGDIFSLYNNLLCVPNLEDSQNEFPPVYNYKELITYAKPPGTEDCGENLKPCGILDTFGNILCFPKNYKCPLNSIIISSNNDISLSNHTEYKINDGLSIYFGYLESTTNKIIVENYISEIPILSHEWDKIKNEKFKFPKISQFNKLKYKYDNYSTRVVIKENSKNSDFSFTVQNIIDWNQNDYEFLDKYNSFNINLNQSLKWYLKS